MSAAWQEVVSGEDAAIYAYGLAGARLSGQARERAERGRREHRMLRARAAQSVADSGAEVPIPAIAYDVDDVALDGDRAQELLAQVEMALIPIYAQAAADSSGPERARAARSATECASRATSWGAPPEAFPD